MASGAREPSVRRFAPCVARPVPVLRGGAAVASRSSSVIGRSGSILRGRLAPCAGDFGLIGLERVADRSADVASPGLAVAGFRGPVSSVGLLIELIEVRGRLDIVVVVARSHAAKRNSGSGSGNRPAGNIQAVLSTSWTVPACARNVSELRRSVVEFAAANGVREPRLSDVAVAVSEAVTNAVVHAFRGVGDGGTVMVAVAVREQQWIDVRVIDSGSGMAPRDDSPGLGLGLPLIRHLADQFDHRRPDGGVGTELWMRFELTPDGA